MDDRLPLPTLLSQVLVAFVIEFDNEFEHQVPHRTTNHGSTTGLRTVPWLVSMVMWFNFMRFIPFDGISVAELQCLTRFTANEMRMWLTRMSKWWGYVTIERDEKNSAKQSNWIVRPSAGGRKAIEIWRPLVGIIEKRWQERFGKEIIARLCGSMQALVAKLDGDLPDCLPILGYELLSKTPDQKQCPPVKIDSASASEQTLPVLLSKTLLAYAIEFERDKGLSLAICSNILRLTGSQGVRVRDLPRLSGVSKEAVAISLGRLEEWGFVVVQPESAGSRVKTLVLTAKGRDAKDSYQRLVWSIEERWQANFGKEEMADLRTLLEQLVGAQVAQRSPLFLGLELYSDGWRASAPRLEVLPHYPMVLHRGGFPDGS